MSNFWNVRVDPAEAQRVQDGFNDLAGRLSRERAACELRVKDAETRRAVERALANGLADMLRAYPDLFAETQLSPATVDEWAARFAGQI